MNDISYVYYLTELLYLNIYNAYIDYEVLQKKGK